MRPGRTLLVAGLVGGVALVGGSERAGAVRLEPVPEPAILTFPGTKRITYRLRIYGEEREERFVLGINPPRFGGEPVPRDRRSAGARGPGIYGQEGVLAQPIFGQRIVFGDATPVSSGFAIPFLPSCPGYHGFASSGIRYELVVPPQSFSEIVAPFEVSPTPPWVDSDFRMTWTAENSTRTSAPPTLEREQVVRSPRPPVVRNAPRRTGVGLHIILRTKPRSSPFGDLRTRRLKGGRSVVVYGRTVPPVPGDRLTLLTSGPAGKSAGSAEFAWMAPGAFASRAGDRRGQASTKSARSIPASDPTSSPIPHASASCSSPDTRRTCGGGNTGWIGSPGPGRSTLNPPR